MAHIALFTSTLKRLQMRQANESTVAKAHALSENNVKQAELEDENNLPLLVMYTLVGIIFGIVFLKSEIISWFRIQEMFRLQSFFMYGVIGSAIMVGLISTYLIKKFQPKSLNGQQIQIQEKKYDHGKIIGGVIFGMGWALTGACPGPLFAQVGSGYSVILISILSAVAGTWVYGYFREKLPH
jgi:uncharacterized protein